MQPVVHSIFGMTSIYQLLSPLLSILFVPFYPLMMFFHLLGFGYILDSALLWLFSLPIENEENFFPWGMMFFYMGVSIGAIWYKKLFYVTVIVSVLYLLYLFIPIE